MSEETTRTPGERVSLDVEWSDGRVTRMSGKLLLLRDGEAYVETELGDVVGPFDVYLERVRERLRALARCAEGGEDEAISRVLRETEDRGLERMFRTHPEDYRAISEETRDWANRTMNPLAREEED